MKVRKHRFSIVIPAYNEFESVPVLAKEINECFNDSAHEWECIWVDDGSSDSTWQEISNLKGNHKGLRLNRNYGQSTAIMAGIDISQFDVIVTLDADLQNDPKDIAILIDKLDPNVDVVNGYRLKRQDSLFLRKIPSKIANRLARKISGIEARDLGCTLRVFRKRLVDETRLMGEMHRVLPIHFGMLGANSIEYPTNHRERIFGKSKYGLQRTFKFIADLFLAKLLALLISRPLYLFGVFSLIVALVSFSSFALAIILRFTGTKDYIDGSLILITVVLCAISLILLSIGLIGELIIRQNAHSFSNQYRIREKS